MTDDTEMPDAEAGKLTTYSEMFSEYVQAESTWLKSSDPLVFHLRKLCGVLDQQLKTDGEATGPMNTAYLQALTRLERKRPTGPAPSGGPLEGQTSIFDELD